MTASRRRQAPTSVLGLLAVLLSVLGMLLVTAPPASAGTACVEDLNSSDAQRVFLEFGGTTDGTYDGTASLDSLVNDCTEAGGNDISFDAYPDVLVHISCSENLVGLVVGDLGAVTDFWVNTVNRGGNTAGSCQPLETYPTPPPVITTTTEVSDGVFKCGDTVVLRTTTTTTTTTPFVLQDGEYVLDPDSATVEVQESTEDLSLTPEQISSCTPPPQVESTVTVTTGEYGCGDTEVATTTTTVTTTTPYTYDGGLQTYVLDEDAASSNETVEEGSRELTEDEQFACPPPPPSNPPVPTVASFTAGTQCVDNAPVVDYAVQVTEGDEPFGTATLTVTSAEGETLKAVEVGVGASGQLPLGGRDGETVTLTWDVDDTATDLTLATPCVEVLPNVLDQPDPEPEPDPVVLASADEVLPETGATTDMLLILAGALLAAGCSLLLAERRLATRQR